MSTAIYPPEPWKFRCPTREAASDLYHRYLRAGYDGMRTASTVTIYPTSGETVTRRTAERGT